MKIETDAEFIAMVQESTALGYGRMMQIISKIWYRQDPVGALSVGPCYGTLEQLRKRCEKEGHDISHGGSYDWCDRCDVRLDKAAP